MKMSKSIKDYKDAMDNIRISDSFYKRTEALLTEIPEIKLDKKPVMSAGKITAALSAAAACLILAFGVKFVIERNDDITEVQTETSEVTVMTEVTETAPPVINELSEAEQGDMIGVAADSGAPDISDGAGISAAETAPPDTKPKETTSEHAQTTLKSSPPAPANVNPSASPAPAVTSAPAKAPEAHAAEARTEAAETVPLLRDINYDYVTVEITPYFDMGSIKSGENPVKKTGEDCKPIIEFIAGLTETSREIGNYSFTSIFSLQIADENIGVTFYSIYVTDLNAVVITKHDYNGQVRETYAANSSDYEALKHILFLQFGSEDEYELFSNLISGK